MVLPSRPVQDAARQTGLVRYYTPRAGRGARAFGGMLRMSRQMRPAESMLGWYIGVTKWTLGGSNG